MKKEDLQYHRFAPHVESDNLYDRLGVFDKDETAFIKKSYLRLAKMFHPDMPGGDQEKFARIQEAWDCLGDPDERAYYDRNGKFAKTKIKQDEIDKFIVMNFANVVSSSHELRRHRSPFDTIKDNMLRNIDLERDKIHRAQEEQKKLERMKSRLTFSGEGKNPVEVHYEGLIASEKDNEVNAGIAVDLLEASIAYLPKFGWKDLDPERDEGSLSGPGSRRPQFVADMRNNRQPTQAELQDIHRRGGRY